MTMAPDNPLREQYLAALDQEILNAEEDRAEIDAARARGLAVSDFMLGWLLSERDRVRAGGGFDEAFARRFLDENAERDR